PTNIAAENVRSHHFCRESRQKISHRPSQQWPTRHHISRNDHPKYGGAMGTYFAQEPISWLCRQRYPTQARGLLGAAEREFRGEAARGARDHRPEWGREEHSAEGAEPHHGAHGGTRAHTGQGGEPA